MRITRRDFMKYCAISAGALGLTGTDLMKIQKALATESANGGTRVVWLNGAACTGCTVSFANTIFNYAVQDLLVPWQVLPAGDIANADATLLTFTHGANGPLDLDFIETLSSAVGARAVDAAFDVLGTNSKDKYVLCLEGSIQTASDGDYCQIWKTNKVHTDLKKDSFVWSSEDREALGIPNDTSETIKVVNPITLGSSHSLYGTIELHPGSVLALEPWSGAGAVTPPTTLPATWTTGVTYAAGAVVKAGTENGIYYRTTLGGVAGATDPGTLTIALGTPVSDGTVSWTGYWRGCKLVQTSWVEMVADRTLIDRGSTFDVDNHVQTIGGVYTWQSITLSGRVEALAGSKLTRGSKISSCSLVYTATDRVALGGIYTFPPRSIEDKQVNNDRTLTGKVMIAAGSILATGTILALGSWIETEANLTGKTTPTMLLDSDNKVTAAEITLTSDVTLTGRVEALAGSVLKAVHVGAASFLNDTAGQTDRTFKDEVLNFAIDDRCIGVVAIGTCASFGGIPAANGSVTDARGLVSTGSIEGGYATVNTTGYWDYLLDEGAITSSEWADLMDKTICVSGCPPHPDWIVGSIVYILEHGKVSGTVSKPLMDKYHRPNSYYGKYQCYYCLWQDNTPATTLPSLDSKVPSAKTGRATGDSPSLYLNKYDGNNEGCIGILGCKGRKTKADCSYRRWNSNTNGSTGAGTGWCVLTRAGCHGCTEPRFPDGWGKFFGYK